MKTKFYVILIIIISYFSCNEAIKFKNEIVGSDKNRTIVIQPFSNFSIQLSQQIFEEIKLLHPNVVLRKPIVLPKLAYNSERKRYRADSLIRFLKQLGSNDTVVIGLTNVDISTTKGNKKDWGVMGLGFCPGNACVVSTFRLLKNDLNKQFYKVAIHELGHTQGLPHCKIKTCFMRDAEGGNPLHEETNFCESCSSFLKRKGWQLK